MKYMKCMLVLLTSILTLIGLTLITLITLIKVKYPHLETISGSQPIDITVIAVAVLLCLVSFIGCCGAATRHPRLLKAFIFFVVLLLLIKVAIVVVIFTQQDAITKELRKLWEKTDDKNRIEFQNVFHCCDVEDAKLVVRASQNDTSCFDAKKQKRAGCIKVMSHIWNENLILIAGFTSAVGLSEIIIVVISCILIFDDAHGDRTATKSRVVPMTINVEPAVDEDEFPARVPLSDRRAWAKHSFRGKDEKSSNEKRK